MGDDKILNLINLFKQYQGRLDSKSKKSSRDLLATEANSFGIPQEQIPAYIEQNADKYEKLAGIADVSGGVKKIGESGLKFIPKLADKVDDILSKINTIDKQQAIRGTPEYSQYLKALDKKYGQRLDRAQNMEFNVNDKMYHGTSADIKNFDQNKASRDAYGVFEKKPAGYFTKSPSDANDYAEDAASKMDTDFLVEEFEKKFKSLPKEQQTTDLWNKEINSIYDTAGQGVGENILPVYLKTKMPLNYKAVRQFQEANTKAAPWFDSIVDDSIGYKAIKNPNQIRSVNAAFDPRFTDSDDILAGALALPEITSLDTENIENEPAFQKLHGLFKGSK